MFDIVLLNIMTLISPFALCFNEVTVLNWTEIYGLYVLLIYLPSTITFQVYSLFVCFDSLRPINNLSVI